METREDHRSVLERLRRGTRGVPVFSAHSSWGVKDPPRVPDALGSLVRELRNCSRTHVESLFKCLCGARLPRLRMVRLNGSLGIL